MSEDVAEELVRALAQGQQCLEWDTLRHIIAHTLAYRSQIQWALVENRGKVGPKVVIPRHLVNVIEFEEIGRHHDIQHIIVIYFIHVFAHLLIISFLHELNDELKGFKVACQRDLDAFLVRDTFNDWSEVLNVRQGPLFIEENFFIRMVFASSYDHFDLCEIERLFIHYLDIRVVILIFGIWRRKEA